jgi:hypothetical protein
MPSSSLIKDAATSPKIEFLVDDTTGRILFDGHWLKKDKKVKYAAYSPMRNGDKLRLETSVFKIDGLDSAQIVELGEFVSGTRGKPWFGHAELKVQHIEGESLSVDSTPEYHPLHGDIIKWPEDKAEQKEIAIRLAKAANLRLRDN